MEGNELLSVILGGSIVFIIVLALLLIPFIIFYLVCLYKLFKKAGKNGWEALIPYYNSWVLVEISGLNWWYFLIIIAPFLLNLIGLDALSGLAGYATYAVNFFIFYNLAKKMHKDPIGFGIGGIFVSGILIIIMGISKDFQYDASVMVSPNGPIGEDASNLQKQNNQHNATNNTNEKFCSACGNKVVANAEYCTNCGKKL